eukprot:jgi/Phyca11/506339/fgenesh2_kg.PHYCAscaffold_19_\
MRIQLLLGHPKALNSTILFGPLTSVSHRTIFVAELALKKTQHVSRGVNVSIHSHTTTAIVQAMEYTVNLSCAYFAIPT